MRSAIFPFLVLILTSCKQKPTQQREAENPTKTHVGKLNDEQTIQLKYYKCDYAKNKYDTILSSGNKHETTEVWGIDKSDIAKLPILNRKAIDRTVFIKIAAQHIKDRLPDINLLSSSFTLQRINEKDTSNPRNWFVDITFLYDEKGYYQEVPVLLNGKIILSNNE